MTVAKGIESQAGRRQISEADSATCGGDWWRLVLLAVTFALAACTPCTKRTVCLQCGPVDECLRPAQVCVAPCSSSDDCAAGDTCVDGGCHSPPSPCL